MTTQNAPRTARQRARAELTREITEEARRQLAATGADGLSLRAVARELGMVSSALYRYYPSRDDLLTALIIDAYNSIGEVAEAAIAGTRPAAGGAARARWLAACHAIRDWSVARPHEYALIYGSPVPGYRAPEATIGPAARVPLAFVGVLAAAIADGEVAAGGVAVAGPLTGALADQVAALSAALAADPSAPSVASLPPAMLVRGVIAWTQLFGMISFELFGQFVGSFEPADAFFGYAAAELATFVGLS
ncbi:MAG: TetR/AcrR family transcriptional regulator [Trebonia sp.]|jgi:AcrR family transcriptional regulator